MAARNGDDGDRSFEPHGEQDRYTDVRLDTGELVIYDVDNSEAWVQSASAVALDAMA